MNNGAARPCRLIRRRDDARRRQDRETARRDALATYRRHDPDARARIAAALAATPLDGGLLIAEATLRHEADEPDAARSSRDMLDRAPDWMVGHDALARLL